MNSDVCGCCLSRECSMDDKLENYGVMLSETFNLSLNNSQRLICEDCLTKLRDAASFKQQILEVDGTLKKLITENTDLCVKSDYDDDDFNYKDWQSPKSEDEIFDVKSEPGLHAETVDTHLCENDNKIQDFFQIEGNHHTSENESENQYLLKIKKPMINVPCENNEKLKCSTIRKKNTNSQKKAEKEQLENTIKLLTNSNICLFKSLRTKFACYVCNEKFFDIKDLRAHTKIHSKEDCSRRVKRLRGKSYENADITNLTCNICMEKCTDLDILQKHLNTAHNIIFTDTNHVLIPFKLGEGFNCQYCKESFHTFTRLSIHMNTHATSNVCETCGMAFYNRISLRNHIRSLHKEHECTQCTLKFPTLTKLFRHKRITHNAAHSKHHCSRCTMTFRYSYLLKNHKVEKHGVKHKPVHCIICKKMFKNDNYLKVHFRCVHLNERQFSCSVCELRFFRNSCKIRHEKVHHGGSILSCNFCETTFKSKDSVRRHLKMQHGFRC